MRKTSGRSASRRHFLKQAGAIALASLPVGNRLAIANSDSPDTKDATAVIKNRKPLAEAPVKLSVEARKVPAWRAVDGVADPVPKSPVTSTENIETITLVPYAAAKLRITSFRELKS